MGGSAASRETERGARDLRGAVSRRRRALGAGLLAATLAVAGCGSSSHFVDNAKPAAQVDLIVYIDNDHVSISPNRVGAGPVLLFITNEASSSQRLSIRSTSGGAVATSGQINSGQAAQLPTDLTRAGSYELLTGSQARPAGLRVTRARPNATRSLLAP
jgi:hypothetical protein